MYNKPSHFAIYIDQMDRASSFYHKVFDWTFQDYGTSDFKQIKSESNSEQVIGALQHRKYSPIPDKIIGFECSITVENIDVLIPIVIDNGGKIVMPKTAIPGVGWIVKFLDTEGNLLCAIEYNDKASSE